LPFPGGTYLTQIAQLGSKVAAEFDQLYALFEGYLRVQHKEDGTHAALTADSVTVTGDVSVDGDGSFDGDVTADADGQPIALEADSILGPGVAIRGTNSQWRIAASPSADTLTIRDEGETNTSTLRLVKTATGATQDYDVLPGNSAVLISLGNDASGQRMAEVNTVAASVSGAATINGLIHLASKLTPAQITVNQNDYAISTASRVFLTSDAARDITGIVAGAEGQVLRIINAGSFAITLKFLNGGSAAGNQIVAANSADAVIRTNGTAVLVYDVARSVWHVDGV
jgi:hypothetical protein